MLPVIAIVGRPNVGKSTLFNKLTGRKDALVLDMPGITRDRQYGLSRYIDKSCWVIDTGGIAESSDPEMAVITDQQVELALVEANAIVLMVDAQTGITTADEQIVADLRRRYSHKRVILAVNKSDRDATEMVLSDFYSLGLSDIFAISATSTRGVEEMMNSLLQNESAVDEDEAIFADDESIKVAIIGRPNVGKSTLVNRILGEERTVVCDRPGTTRDSIQIPFERRGVKYTLIDTAGLRRRSKVSEAIEKFSAIKTLESIKKSHVVVMVMDAHERVTDQDLKLIGHVLQMGRAIVLAFNKWDDMDSYDRQQFQDLVDRKLVFLDFARRYYISALHGSGVGKLYHAIDEAYESASRVINTATVTKVLMQAVEDHQPPLVGGRRVKLRYAHIGEHHPLTLAVHGKQVEALPGSYKRYLSSYFRKAFKLVGVPVIINYRNDYNPYASS